MYPYAHPGPGSSHDMQQQMEAQQQMAIEQQMAMMQLHQAHEMHLQLVNQQHMIHQQGLYVQQQYYEQYSYAVPEYPQQFAQPAFFMPPPPHQQIPWDGGGLPPPEERPPPREKLRTSECRHFARGFCLRGDRCNFAHTTPKEKQGAQDSLTPHRTRGTQDTAKGSPSPEEASESHPCPRAMAGPDAAAACTQKRPWSTRRNEQCLKFQRHGSCNRDQCPYMHGIHPGYGISPQQAALPGAGHFPRLPSRPHFVSDESTSQKDSPPSGNAVGNARPESETAGAEGAVELPSWASLLTEQAAEETARPAIRSDSDVELTSKVKTARVVDVGKKFSKAGEFSKATDAADETRGITTDEFFHEEASVAA